MRFERGRSLHCVRAVVAARCVSLVVCMVAFTAGASVLGSVGPASAAATLTVCSTGCQYTTITNALNAATAGDTIMIGPGAYGGGLTIDKNLSLIGAGSAQTTISGGSPVVTVSSGVRSTIRGLTISGGVAGPFGGGVNNAGTLSVADSTVTENNPVALPAFGGGIYNTGSLTLNHSTVAGNGGDGSGLI